MVKQSFELQITKQYWLQQVQLQLGWNSRSVSYLESALQLDNLSVDNGLLHLTFRFENLMQNFTDKPDLSVSDQLQLMQISFTSLPEDIITGQVELQLTIYRLAKLAIYIYTFCNWQDQFRTRSLDQLIATCGVAINHTLEVNVVFTLVCSLLGPVVWQEAMDVTASCAVYRLSLYLI